MASTTRDIVELGVLVWSRARDRLGPWAAEPPTQPGARHVAVIGAGPAGLATAALLQRNGARATVLDRRREVGGSWPSRYDSLRLNTVRWMSDLPGYRMPRSLGRWVGRDDIVEYLREYARHHRIDTRLGVSAGRLEHDSDGWTVPIDNREERFDAVVVATGHARLPTLPEWPGSDTFTGRLLHSSAYRRPADHVGRRVLVVGAGSSGGEIAVDLATAGVDVTWAIRSAPQVLPREVASVPTTPFGPVGDLLPDRLLDRVMPWVERRIYGRRDYLPEPVEPMMQLLADCKEPMTADGIVDLIRAGRVRVVAAVDRFDGDSVVLTDGARVDADDVIAATGYRPALEPLVGHLGVLDDSGRPTAVVPRRGLAFVGYRIPLTGTLWAIDGDARRAAGEIALAATGRRSTRNAFVTTSTSSPTQQA